MVLHGTCSHQRQRRQRLAVVRGVGAVRSGAEASARLAAQHVQPRQLMLHSHGLERTQAARRVWQGVERRERTASVTWQGG